MVALMSRSKAGIFLIVMALMAQMTIGRATPAAMDGGAFGTVICKEQSAERQVVGQAGAPIKAVQEHDCSACLLHCQFSLFSESAHSASTLIAPVAVLHLVGDLNEALGITSSRGAAHRTRAPPSLS